MRAPQFLTPETVQKCFSDQKDYSSGEIYYTIGYELQKLAGALSSQLPMAATAVNNVSCNLHELAAKQNQIEISSMLFGYSPLAQRILAHIERCDHLNCADELTVAAMREEYKAYYPQPDTVGEIDFFSCNYKYIKAVLGDKRPLLTSPATSPYDFQISLTEDDWYVYRHPLEGMLKTKKCSSISNARLKKALDLEIVSRDIELATDETLQTVSQEIIDLLSGFEEMPVNKAIQIDSINLYCQKRYNETEKEYVINSIRRAHKFEFNGDLLELKINFSKDKNTFKISVQNNPKEHWAGDFWFQHEVNVNLSDAGVYTVETIGWKQYAQCMLEQVKKIIIETIQPAINQALEK